MSPERINNASRSAANDIWSVGATFVQMVTGQRLNHLDNFPQFMMNISQYKIFINGKPYEEFLQALNENDFRKKIISRTLCIASNRANCHELLSIVSQYMQQLQAAHPEAEPHQSRREGSHHMGNELQLGARRAVPRGLREQSGARDTCARQRRRPARRVQSPTRHYSIHLECVSHERLGHTARVFGGKCTESGGTSTGWWH